MYEVINPLLQWLNANPNWAGFITFLISAGESVAVIGTIVPGSIMMTAIGALAGAGIIPLWPTLFWAILGAIIGDGISYWLGYYFKGNLHTIWPFRTHPEMLVNGERFFTKFGGMSVFIGRFVGPVRALVPLIAGMFGVKPLRFTIANILSAIGWAPVYMLPGILLGAASLELPPDVTTHAFTTLLLITLFFILCLWIVWKIFSLINNQINQALTSLWSSLKQSRYFNMVTWLLKHHNPTKTHGQLAPAFYWLLVTSLFLSLAVYLTFVSPQTIFINNIFFYLFRSLHTPAADNAMLAMTLLGEMFVHWIPLLLIAGVIFLWLALSKRWYTAWHVFAATLLAATTIEVTKYLLHVSRPWGVLQPPHGYSFPSGHSALSTVFWFGLVLLLCRTWQIKRKWPLFIFAGMIVFLVGISRCYLGVHWVTDVVGGWLLGASVMLLITLSYKRQKEERIPNGKRFIIAMLITLTISYSYVYYRYHDNMKKDYAQLDWPTYTVPLNTWWEHTGDHLPLYRLNRFGINQEVLNLQWAGSLEKINRLLLSNDWESPPDRDLASILQRITDVNSAEHLPLVSPLYLDKKPALVLTKKINGDKKLIVLRLWKSNLNLEGTNAPLWVGFVDIVPRTYSWLFKKTKARKITLTKNFLFSRRQDEFTTKQLIFNATQNNRSKEYSIILLKPQANH